MRSIFEDQIRSNVVVALEAYNGMSNSTRNVIVREVRDGLEARAEVFTDDGHAERIFRVSSDRSAAFWDDLEKLDCWSLSDKSDMATDLTGYRVFLRRGRRTLELSCYGFIEDSPQRRLVQRVERLGGIEALVRRVRRESRRSL